MSRTIGIDIGGTKVLAGVVDPEGEVVTSRLRSTPAADVVAIRDVIVESVAELRAEYEVSAVGIGAAGWIDSSRSTVQFAPNLAWRDEPLRDLLAAHIDLPIVVENDANVAAWAEFQYGAARDADSAALFTVGTGIGGGIVLNGDLVRGSHGIAAEFGHTLAVPDGTECGCGRHGCLEQYASGNALVRFAKEAAAGNPSEATLLLKSADGEVDDIDGPMVTEAARAGDPVSVAAFVKVGGYLGEALADMVQLLDPDILVIGGGVINAGELLLAPARQRYRAVLHARSRLPVAEIVAAQMGPQAGIIGAADLARR
ncbi:glucokinase [Stackebrandtia endophytica]|uniref:Glucokinase n=1 Tax=Stackebrandtia endophytica TaxID=1496996 RepID=A0A543B289_9ACTN|nr:ROK family glucokinase [Stackebrandtia endophytica]TQL78948.1 glucokinase [Stackebrandtia endophytica]